MSTPIKTGLIAYTSGYFSANEITFVTSHFDILDTDFGLPAATVTALKSGGVTVLGYRDLIAMKTTYSDWDTVDANEDWFLHDVGENRLYNSTYSFYLMDPASVGWREHFVSQVNTAITAGGYNGVFVDDVWNQVYNHMSNVQAADSASWHADVVAFLTYIKANISPGKLVIVNSDEWNASTYVAEVDGEMIEGYAHESWTLANSPGGRQTPLILTLISKLATDAAAGKIVWCASGSLSESTSILQMCYVSFLLGVTGENAYWSFNDWYADSYKGYRPIMSTSIGDVDGAFYDASSVYWRDFTNGKVVCNPTANTYDDIALGDTYKFIDGSTSDTVTLQPYSAEVLLIDTSSSMGVVVAVMNMMRRR
jgi:hypothetical protein